MRRSSFSLEKLYTFVTCFLSNVQSEHKTKKRGRPHKYGDKLIIALWLYQTLMGLSYRETLALASQQNFPTPSLRDYHYRVKNLDEKLLKVLMDAIDIIQRVLELGCESVIRVKETFRMKIKHSLRKVAKENRGEVLKK